MSSSLITDVMDVPLLLSSPPLVLCCLSSDYLLPSSLPHAIPCYTLSFLSRDFLFFPFLSFLSLLFFSSLVRSPSTDFFLDCRRCCSSRLSSFMQLLQTYTLRPTAAAAVVADRHLRPLRLPSTRLASSRVPFAGQTAPSPFPFEGKGARVAVLGRKSQGNSPAKNDAERQETTKMARREALFAFYLHLYLRVLCSLTPAAATAASCSCRQPSADLLLQIMVRICSSIN